MTILKKYKNLILENLKQAKGLVLKQYLTDEQLSTLVSLDDTQSKKNVGWMAYQLYVSKTAEDPNELAEDVNAYQKLIDRGIAEVKDISTLKSYQALKEKLSTTRTPTSELKKQFDIRADNEHYTIFNPHTHEASRYLGLKYFAFRKKTIDDTNEDCAWCTTYANPSNWISHYENQDKEVFYIKPKSEEFKTKLKEAFPSYDTRGFAFLTTRNQKRELWDGSDHLLPDGMVDSFLQLL